MKKTLLLLGLLIIIIASIGSVYLKSQNLLTVAYSVILGAPQPHNTFQNSPTLAIDLVFDHGHSRVIAKQENGQIMSWDLQTGYQKRLFQPMGCSHIVERRRT